MRLFSVLPIKFYCVERQKILLFFIVTHSPILLGIPDADIYCFDNGSIHLCEYEETESYQVTEMFINNRQMLLDKLLIE